MIQENVRRSIRFFLQTFVIATLGWTVAANAHEEDSRISVEVEQTQFKAGQFQFEFQLVDTKLKKLVSESDLNITHEQKLHLLVYDPSLQEFHHVHPIFKNDRWVTELDIPVNGKYWVWAQGEITSDGEEFSASTRITIQGGQNAWPTPPKLTDIRQGNSGLSQVTIDNKKLTAKKMVMLNLKFARTDGTAPKLKPYLGAFAHVVAVPDDADSLLHVHPMNTADPNMGMLHVTFPRAGFYRLWVQFIDDEILKVVPLSVQVF